VLLYSITPLNAATPWLHVDGNKIKDPAGNVVVLRGVDTIDLGETERNRGGAIAMIDRLTNKSDTQGSSPGWYPRVIRLAIYPADEGDFNSPWTFEPGSDDYYNNLLRPVVDYCKSKDLYVIVDWHYVGDDTWDKVAQTSEFWEYMAPRFANDSHVLFELFNEPKNNTLGSEVKNWLSVRKDMQTWINIVRSYAPNNLILVAGPSYSQIIGPVARYPLTGDNIVIVSHIYPGHWFPAGKSWCMRHIRTCLTVYPVFMSEWGFRESAGYELLRGTITNYGQPLTDFCERLKISNSAWVADYSWQPPIFNSDWTLRVGEGEMGGFVKDTLYLKRNDDQPSSGDVTPPAAPTGLVATAGDLTVSLDWDGNGESDLYGYDVYRSITSGSDYSRINLARSSSSNYTDNNVNSGTTYYYVVAAVDTSFNKSRGSSEVSATPSGTTPPSTPTGPVATSGSD